MKNNQVIGIVLVGAAMAMLLTKKQQQTQLPPWYVPGNHTPPPTTSGSNWTNYVSLIIQLYGAVAWLWSPGGPFYKVPTSQVYDAVAPNVRDQYNWNDPNSVPGGWA